MNCLFQKNGTILLEHIDSFQAKLLLEPFQNNEISSEIIGNYFLQKINKQDPLFSQDWKEYVAPELESLLVFCHQQVIADLTLLQNSSSHDGDHTLAIPLAHRDAWLRMLSTVRLLLSSRHEIDGQEIQEKDLLKISAPQKKALLQMELFAVIQQCLVEAEGRN
ncbi:MAG: hypothetical protein QE493_06190 [Verrucomicrobiae bacterium]|jgi:hypothetical protein|nr:hypothetical protein [Verrucomicrobiae bacterium]